MCAVIICIAMAKFEFENWNMCNGRRARLLFSSCLFGRQLNMTVANEGKWATTTELKKKKSMVCCCWFCSRWCKARLARRSVTNTSCITNYIRRYILEIYRLPRARSHYMWNSVLDGDACLLTFEQNQLRFAHDNFFFVIKCRYAWFSIALFENIQNDHNHHY